MKKIRLILLLLLPLSLLIPTAHYLFNSSLVLFPNENYYRQYMTSHTAECSIEEFTFDNDSMYLRFRMKDGFDTPPYASLIIWLDEGEAYQDLSEYSYLTVDVIEATYKEVVIFLKTYLPGISKPSRKDAVTLRHNEYTLPLQRSAATYTIELRKFFTPDWWYDMLTVPDEARDREDFKNTAALDFQFMNRRTFPVTEQSETFIVKRIAFHKAYPLPALVLACLAGACYLGWGAYRFFTRCKQAARVELAYTPLPLTNFQDDTLSRLKDYIKTHYTDPHISTRQIAGATGISRAHVIELIKKEYNETCKQLINKIRITEAQRLLKTTDRRIVEIALELGFNDITTFNRCFKKLTGKSPSRYRAHP